jgi:hypothetical protein
MIRLQLTVKETFGMSELQNNTVIVPPTYFILKKRAEMDYNLYNIWHVKFCS